MAEIETALPPAEKPLVVGDYSSNDEKASPSLEHGNEHEDNRPALETEEFNDQYDPNVYARASCLNPTPH